VDDDPSSQLIADSHVVRKEVIIAHRCKTPPPVLRPDSVAEDV
jgi:hypothetical protein